MQDLFLKMEKIRFVKNGVLMRLPPGFRFCPTDEELVVEYLKKKVLCLPLPASVIPEFDARNLDPWNLPGDKEKDKYFFSTKETKYLNGKWSNRATLSGYWKATGKEKEIVNTKAKQVVGMKKALVFYRGKPQHGFKTDWFMHQFRLVGIENISVQKWVVCRIFLEKRSSKTSYEPNLVATVTDTRLMYHNLIWKDNIGSKPSPCSSFSGSSGVTVISNCEYDDPEENSTCNPFSSFRKENDMQTNNSIQNYTDCVVE